MVEVDGGKAGLEDQQHACWAAPADLLRGQVVLIAHAHSHAQCHAHSHAHIHVLILMLMPHPKKNKQV